MGAVRDAGLEPGLAEPGLDLGFIEPVDTLMHIQDARRGRACPPAVPGPERWSAVVDAAFTEATFEIHCKLTHQVTNSPFLFP